MLTIKKPPPDLGGIVPVRPARAKGDYEAVPHRRLVEEIEKALTDKEWPFLERKLWVRRDGMSMACGWALVTEEKYGLPGWNFGVGVMNSNGRSPSLAMKLYSGLVRKKDGMGMALASFEIGPHRKFVVLDLKDRVKKAVGRAGGAFFEHKELSRELSRKQVSEGALSLLLLLAARKNLLPWSRLGAVEKAYREGGKDAWSLLCHLALVNSLSPAIRQFPCMLGLLKLVKEVSP